MMMNDGERVKCTGVLSPKKGKGLLLVIPLLRVNAVKESW